MLVGRGKLCYAGVVALMAAERPCDGAGGQTMTSQLAVCLLLGAYLALLIWLRRR